MPEGFQLGPVFIHFYGILIMLGVLAATWLSTREAPRYDQDPEVAWDVVAWVLIAGIIGARIWHILTPPQSMVDQGITTMYYLTHPLEAIAIWNGGLGIPGAVIGGALAVFIYMRSHKMSFLTWADIIAPGLALAQAIGRWGNFFNQELYGSPTTLPWGIYIDPAHRLSGYEQNAYYQPLFLYESLFNLVNMGFLLWLGRRFKSSLKPGDVFLSYLVTYPTARFFLEFLRLDPSHVGGIDINQTLMAVIVVCASALLIWRHWPRSHRQAAESGEIIEEESVTQTK